MNTRASDAPLAIDRVMAEQADYAPRPWKEEFPPFVVQGAAEAVCESIPNNSAEIIWNESGNCLESEAARRKSIPLCTRKDAVAAGKLWYFTGKPCTHGHIDERHVKRRTCRTCLKDRDRRRHRQDNRQEYARRNSWRRNGMPEPTRPRPAVCEMCGQPPTARALHLDHDHKTGVFRGWLCHYCNTNLGRFGDQVEGLVRAAQYLGWSEINRVQCSLPDDASQRKDIPLWDGLFAYFPDALMAVATLSKIGNDQHNPGKPLRWDRQKSPDHLNCLLRHLLQHGTIDTDGVRHTAKVAWRALALLQLEIESSRIA